jgi:hypothetical protein
MSGIHGDDNILPDVEENMQGKGKQMSKPMPTKAAVPHRPTAAQILARPAEEAKLAKAAKAANGGKTSAKPAGAVIAAKNPPHEAHTPPPAAPAAAQAAPSVPATPAPVMNIPDGFTARTSGSKGNGRVIWCPAANTPVAKIIQTEGKPGDRCICPHCKKNLKVNMVKVKGSEKAEPRVPYHGIPNKVPATSV